MKKCIFPLVVMLGFCFSSCKDKDEKTETPTITLSSPAANAPTIDLKTVEDVTFSWSLQGDGDAVVADGFTLVLSKTQDLSSPVTFTTTNLLYQVPAGNLDAQLKDWAFPMGGEATVYWSVKPKTAGQANEPAEGSRALKLIRLPVPPPVISLSAPAEGALIDLDDVEDVNFSWQVQLDEGTFSGSVTLLIAKTSDLSSPITFTVSGNSKAVASEDLDAHLAEWDYAPAAEATVYWSVKLAEGPAVEPDARALKLKRFPPDCDNMGRPQNVVARPGNEKVRLVWDQNPDPRIVSTTISWNNGSEPIEHVFNRTQEGWQPDSIEISGLTEGTAYTFELVNKSADGCESQSVASSSCTPYGPVYAASIADKVRKVTWVYLTGYNFGNTNFMNGNNSPFEGLGKVTIEWEVAPADWVETKVSYKKNGTVETEVFVTNPAAPAAINLTEVGNQMRNPDHAISYTSYFMPTGGFEPLPTKTLKCHVVMYQTALISAGTWDAYRIRTLPTAAAWNFGGGAPAVPATGWNHTQKMFWSTNQEGENLDVWYCDKVFNFPSSPTRTQEGVAAPNLPENDDNTFKIYYDFTDYDYDGITNWGTWSSGTAGTIGAFPGDVRPSDWMQQFKYVFDNNNQITFRGFQWGENGNRAHCVYFNNDMQRGSTTVQGTGVNTSYDWRSSSSSFGTYAFDEGPSTLEPANNYQLNLNYMRIYWGGNTSNFGKDFTPEVLVPMTP